ncbi:MAG TPA: glucose-1-phosphate thymidylyltransferase [Thermoanaerobaculia bacterium]|jgi:glucose-1-phosphate thymidylyltransferase|nr:glucose-1-phosphate thymidylyltransferase [Thermoanaerobaculia bacterium]
MKGLILSGGKGTRLRPLTYTRAKQLVPVANKPVLFYGVEAIVAAGIRRIGVVVGETRDEIRNALGDGSRFGAEITYIEQEAPLGLAHAVLISEPYLKGESFVMYLGDNLIADGITSLVEEYQRIGCNSQILLAKVANPEQFGVAELLNGTVIRLTEKPREPRSNLALVGVYMFDDSIWDAVKSIRPSVREELEITDAIQWLIDHGRSVHPHIVSGWWKDTGKVEDMLEANRIILDTFTRRGVDGLDNDSRVEGKVVIEPGARIYASTIRGPAIIGAGAEIRSAFVGPYTSIGPGCRVERCEIENSIVLEGSSLERIPGRIADSLIGTNVRIHPGAERPRVHRFLVSDNSEIGIV